MVKRFKFSEAVELSDAESLPGSAHEYLRSLQEHKDELALHLTNSPRKSSPLRREATIAINNVESPTQHLKIHEDQREIAFPDGNEICEDREGVVNKETRLDRNLSDQENVDPHETLENVEPQLETTNDSYVRVEPSTISQRDEPQDDHNDIQAILDQKIAELRTASVLKNATLKPLASWTSPLYGSPKRKRETEAPRSEHSFLSDINHSLPRLSDLPGYESKHSSKAEDQPKQKRAKTRKHRGFEQWGPEKWHKLRKLVRLTVPNSAIVQSPKVQKALRCDKAELEMRIQFLLHDEERRGRLCNIM